MPTTTLSRIIPSSSFATLDKMCSEKRPCVEGRHPPPRRPARRLAGRPEDPPRTDLARSRPVVSSAASTCGIGVVERPALIWKDALVLHIEYVSGRTSHEGHA